VAEGLPQNDAPTESATSVNNTHELTDDEFWALSEGVYNAALEQEIPVAEVTLGPERWQIEIVIRAERSDELAQEVDAHLRPPASEWGSEVTFTYDPEAENVPFVGKSPIEE